MTGHPNDGPSDRGENGMKVKTKIKNEKNYKRVRRHLRVRQRVIGTPEKPRLCVFKSAKHIYALIVDDTAGRTLLSVSSLKLGPLTVPQAPEKKPEAAEPAAEVKPVAKTETKGKGKDKGKGKEKPPEKKEKKEKQVWMGGRKTAAAREVGRLVAEAAKAKGISAVCFDRGGYQYHGRVAALADAARRNGLRF
jgi:large subunit ribosomal protein L18